MAGGHDQLFKDLLRAFPAGFVRLVEESLAARLDLRRLDFQPTELFAGQPKGAQRRLDLVAQAKARDSEGGPLLLHVEIERCYRSSVPARLWLYNNLLHQRDGLPVHTTVLWLRGGPPGLSYGEHRQELHGQEIHRFRYRSLGLSGAPAETFLAHPEPLAWALAALMRPAHRDRLALRRACLTRIAAARRLNPARRFLLFNCVATYLELDGGAREEFAALLAEHRGTEDRTMMTWAEKEEAKAEARGEAKGEARGEARGEAKGEAKGMRKVLLRLLRQRFAPLPATTAKKVAAISSPEELENLADQLFTARSLEELGLA